MCVCVCLDLYDQRTSEVVSPCVRSAWKARVLGYVIALDVMPLDVPRMLACCAAFGDVDGAQETNLTLYVSSYYYRCVLTLL